MLSDRNVYENSLTRANGNNAFQLLTWGKQTGAIAIH